MGRKSNLRKKFGKLKLRQEEEQDDDQRPDVECSSSSMENNAASREELADDRLTSLPEKIITNILSCLEISEAVRTCVLSKSWVSKWISITKLTCLDGFPFPKPNFLDGLESVIPKVSGMRQFSLNCCHMHNPSRLESLVFSALDCPLETLNLSIVSAPCSFSLGSFDMKSLMKLELSGKLSVTAFPDDVCNFSHLKSLRLFDVTLESFPLSPSSGKFIMRMPALEKLKLIKCKFCNVENLEIVSPLLRKLSVVLCTYYDLIGLLSPCVVEISGGSNIEFTYVGSFSEDFVVRNPSNVAIANLKLCLTIVSGCQHFLEELASKARLLLEKFHTSLEMLELSRDIVMVLANIGPSNPLPVFENLKYAKIPGLWCCPDVMNNVAMEVLMNAPFLEELTISAIVTCKICKKAKRRESKQKSGNIGGTFQTLLAGSFMGHLKKVMFESFNRWVEEVELVRLFLAHASVLEELSIPVTCSVVAKKLENQFSAFPKASGNASVIFHLQD